MMNKVEFEEVFHTYFAAMCFYGEQLTGIRQVAEDLAEDMFFKLWEYGELSKINNTRAYLYTAMRNACLDHIQAAKKQQILYHSHEYKILSNWDTEQETIRSEIIRQMELELDRLPQAYGQVIRMAYIERMPGKAIAKALGVSESTVKKHKAKGLSMLRNILGKGALVILLKLLSEAGNKY